MNPNDGRRGSEDRWGREGERGSSRERYRSEREAPYETGGPPGWDDRYAREAGIPGWERGAREERQSEFRGPYERRGGGYGAEDREWRQQPGRMSESVRARSEFEPGTRRPIGQRFEAGWEGGYEGDYRRGEDPERWGSYVPGQPMIGASMRGTAGRISHAERENIRPWGMYDDERAFHGRSERRGFFKRWGRAPRAYKRSDERIREEIYERLSNPHLGIDAEDVEVSVRNGVVTLTGTIETRYDKRSIEDVCDMVLGVRDVENRLRILRMEGFEEGERESPMPH